MNEISWIWYISVEWYFFFLPKEKSLTLVHVDTTIERTTNTNCYWLNTSWFNHPQNWYVRTNDKIYYHQGSDDKAIIDLFDWFPLELYPILNPANLNLQKNHKHYCRYVKISFQIAYWNWKPNIKWKRQKWYGKRNHICHQ